MQTQQVTNNATPLIVECTRDIRWELEQIRTRVTPTDIAQIVDALLGGVPPVWPSALIELQKGHLVHRLTRHLNFHIRQRYGKARSGLLFTGPFPTFSVKPLLPVARQFGRIRLTAKCIEFIGNTLWGHTLDAIKPKFIPFDIKTATLIMKAVDCSPECHMSAAREDLSRRVSGILANYLLAWEKLLIEQTTSYLLQETMEGLAPKYTEAVV